MFEPISLSNAALAQIQPVSSSQEQPFLQFCLEPDVTALLPLQHSVEVLSIPRKEIIPIFYMPAWVTGVYNLRGEILWIVDLGHLLGLSPCYQSGAINASFTTLVLNTSAKPSARMRNQLLGCMISRLEAIEQCHPNQIQPPILTDAHRGLAPFLRGYWLKSDQQRCAVLDVEAIVAAMPKLEV